MNNINTIVKDIESGIEELESMTNDVNKDFSGDLLVKKFEILIYYGLYEKLGEGEIFPKEDLEKMYEIFLEAEDYEKCDFIKKIS